MARKRVASEPVLRDWAAVDATLRDIRECRHALVELGVEKDRRIDGIKDEYTRNAVPLQNRIKRLEGDVKDYVDAHRAELCGKSRVLTFGTGGYRLSSKLVIASSKVFQQIRTVTGGMSVERLTDKMLTKACNDPWDYCGLDAHCTRHCTQPTPCKIPALVHRLAKIENILGDNYDLDRLRELVEADNDGRFGGAAVAGHTRYKSQPLEVAELKQ